MSKIRFVRWDQDESNSERSGSPEIQLAPLKIFQKVNKAKFVSQHESATHLEQKE